VNVLILIKRFISRKEKRTKKNILTLNFKQMNKQELIKEIEFIIDGMSLGENAFKVINNIKKLIENESK